MSDKLKNLNDLYIVLNGEITTENRDTIAKEFVNKLKDENICEIFSKLNLLEKIQTSLTNSNSITSREGGLAVCINLYETFGYKMEQYSASLIPILIYLCDDKMRHIQLEATRCLKIIFENMNPYSIEIFLKVLYDGMDNISWKIKVGSLTLLNQLSKKHPERIAYLLPNIVPQVTKHVWDTKKEVKNNALDTLLSCCSVIQNPDIKPIVPTLVDANANPKKNDSALDVLMGTTFVSQVGSPTLAIIVPVLSRGLRSRDVQTKRKCCVVIDNMCRLVHDQRDVEPFVDKLLPELNRVESEVAIKEIREYGTKAKNTLLNAVSEGNVPR